MADEPEDARVGRDLGRRWRPLLGIGGLFSGVALLMTILGSISLNLALAGMTLVMLGILGAVLWISGPETRRWIFWTIASGIVAGFTATLAYDASKTALSQLDPSPYDPFHAITIFGTLILGRGADPASSSRRELPSTCSTGPRSGSPMRSSSPAAVTRRFAAPSSPGLCGASSWRPSS